MKILRLLVSAVFLSSSVLHLNAQYESISDVCNYLHFNHLKENVGIENLIVNHVYEDQNGYLWFSTETGLCRFDGLQVKYFHDETSVQPIRLQEANAFCQDQNGDILIGSEGHLFVYKSRQEQFSVKKCAFTDRSQLKSITSLKVYDDKLWMGTQQGLYFASLADSLTFQPLACTKTNDGCPFQISCLLVGPGNHLWVGSKQQGLFMLKKEGAARYRLKPITLEEMDSPHILNLVVYDNYHLLAVTDKGLITINSKQQQRRLLACDNITAVNVTSSGEIWCSTFGSGLYFFKSLWERPVKYEHYSINNSTLNFINTSFVDSRDNLWIMPEKMGVRWLSARHQFIRNHTQSHYGDGLRNNIVKDVKIDARGRWFIGTYYGLSIYDPASRQYTHINCADYTESTNQIESLAFDQHGTLWVGTRDGLHYLEPGATVMKKVAATGRQIIWSLCPSSDGTGLWLGTDQGLRRINLSSLEITTYQLTNSSEENKLEVVALMEDSHQRLWIGTHGSGLMMADLPDGTPSSLLVKRDMPQIKDKYIYSIFEAADHSIWVGCKNGLYHYHKGTVKHFKGEDGKAYNIIKGIAEDQHHRLWLTTHLGIIAFDPATGVRANFNTIDGMSSDIFNIGACRITEQGLLLAGSLMGLVVVRTDSLLKEEVPYPTPYISALSVNNTAIQAGHTFNGRCITEVAPKYLQQITLNHDENNLSVTFGFIEVHHPKRIRCAYRILEQGTQWHTLAEGQNTVNLFNLPQGNYTLEYKTTNANGQWASKAASMQICILPHWSRTPWAYLMYFLWFVLLFAGILAYMKRKVKEKETLEKERALHRQTLALEKDKIEFFTNISHELRTPMTLITAPLHELREKGERLSEEEKRYYVELMNKNAELLDRQLEQLLNFSKIQNGRARLQLAYHQVPMIILHIVENFQDYARQKNIRLTFNDHTTLGRVVCDNHAIEIILCNLISNAIKYSPDDSKVDIDLSLPAAKPGYFCISVQDEGIGISQSQQKDIFKRYARLENARFTAGGIGIGLAYTQSLVQLHEGEIEVRSQLDKGSCFSVYLPLRLSATGESAQSSPFVAAGTLPSCDTEMRLPAMQTEDIEGKDTLLIVEDNTDLQTFLKTLLGKRYRILTASQGKEGWNLACQELPDLIITDVMMPEMDGIEMTRMLKTNFLTSHIPVVMLTAKGEVKDELEGLDAGANFYLRKPFLPQQLELIVKNIQEQQQKMRHYLLSQSNVPDETETTESEELQDEFLQKVTEYIQAHLSAPDLTVENLAEAMNVSSVHLYRKLKQTTNITPNDWIRNLRMQQATQLLCRNDMHVAEVAYAVGYSDPKYFSKCFKTLYGMSPSAYVKAKSSGTGSPLSGAK